MKVAGILRTFMSVITQMFFNALFERSTRLTEIYTIAVLARDLINPGGLDGVFVGLGTGMDEL